MNDREREDRLPFILTIYFVGDANPIEFFFFSYKANKKSGSICGSSGSSSHPRSRDNPGDFLIRKKT